MNKEDRDWQTHVTVLGWLLIVANLIYVVTGFISFFLWSGIGEALGSTAVLKILSIVGTAGFSFLTLLALPGFLAGIGLLRRQQWARYLALAVAVLNLVNFPLGTAVGIYTLWVLLPANAADYLKPLKPA